jgi:hypothetical protein
MLAFTNKEAITLPLGWVSAVCTCYDVEFRRIELVVIDTKGFSAMNEVGINRRRTCDVVSLV